MPGITWEQSRSSLPVLSPVWHWGDSLGVVLWEQSLLLPLPHKHQQPSEWKTAQSALKRDRPLTPPRASPTPCTARGFRSSSSVTKVYASYGNVNPSIVPRARKLLFPHHSFPFVPCGTCQRAGELWVSSEWASQAPWLSRLPRHFLQAAPHGRLSLKISTASLFPSEFSKLVFHLLLHIFLSIPIHTKYCQTQGSILNETACANACTYIFSRLLCFPM